LINEGFKIVVSLLKININQFQGRNLGLYDISGRVTLPAAGGSSMLHPGCARKQLLPP